MKRCTLVALSSWMDIWTTIRPSATALVCNPPSILSVHHLPGRWIFATKDGNGLIELQSQQSSTVTGIFKLTGLLPNHSKPTNRRDKQTKGITRMPQLPGHARSIINAERDRDQAEPGRIAPQRPAVRVRQATMPARVRGPVLLLCPYRLPDGARGSSSSSTQQWL